MTTTTRKRSRAEEGAEGCRGVQRRCVLRLQQVDADVEEEAVDAEEQAELVRKGREQEATLKGHRAARLFRPELGSGSGLDLGGPE